MTLNSGALRYFGRIKERHDASLVENHRIGMVMSNGRRPKTLAKKRNGKIVDKTISEAELPEKAINVTAIFLSTTSGIGNLFDGRCTSWRSYGDRTRIQWAFPTQGCRGIIPGDQVHGPFLYYMLKSRAPELNAMANGTTFALNCRVTILAAVSVAFPPASNTTADCAVSGRKDGADQIGWIEKKRELSRTALTDRNAKLSLLAPSPRVSTLTPP